MNNNNNSTIAVIMGAGVLADGRPGSAMRRRVEGALRLRAEFSNLVFIPTGGLGKKTPRAEADVMQELLIKAGVKAENIIPETEAKTTCESIINCAEIIKKFAGSEPVIVCTDTYHIHRCRFLFLLMGIRALHRNMPSGRKANGWIRWIYFYVREAAALPVNMAVLLIHKVFGKR